MTRYYPDQTIDIQMTHTNNLGALADADEVKLYAKLNDEDETVATVTSTTTGVYDATVTALKPGALKIRWQATNGTKVEPAPLTIKIHEYN